MTKITAGEEAVLRKTLIRSRPLLVAIAAVVAAACRDSSGPPPQPVVTPVDRATAGSIVARVGYTGEVPAAIEINMRSSGRCAELHPEPVFEQPIQVADGRLANALVYIKSGLEDRAFEYPTEPVIIDQKGCLYEPRIAALMVGQALQFVNSDPEAHNVRGRPKTVSAWNFMMSRPQSTRTLYFEKAEIGIRVGCDVHPWMTAWVSVLPHPYFAITGADGTARIENLPPGDYVVGVWHEALGTLEQNVTLPPSGRLELEFEYRR